MSLQNFASLLCSEVVSSSTVGFVVYIQFFWFCDCISSLTSIVIDPAVPEILREWVVPFISLMLPKRVDAVNRRGFALCSGIIRSIIQGKKKSSDNSWFNTSTKLRTQLTSEKKEIFGKELDKMILGNRKRKPMFTFWKNKTVGQPMEIVEKFIGIFYRHSRALYTFASIASWLTTI